MKTFPQGTERILIRLPDGMRDQIKHLAKSQHRTMTGQVVAMLESGLAAEKLASGQPS